MNVHRLDSQLDQLFRVLMTTLLVVAELNIWGIYTQPPHLKVFDWAWNVAIILAPIVLGILLTRIIFGLLHKTARAVALSHLLKIAVFVSGWIVFMVLVNWRLLQLKSFEAVDGQVLLEESKSSLPPGTTADSTQFVTGSQTILAFPSPTPRPVTKPISNDPFANDPYLKNVPWGTTVEIAPHTYRSKIAEDSRMSTVTELYNALNTYRQDKGESTLRIDDFLVQLANVRLNQIPTETEAHKGFMDIMNQTNPSAYEEYGNFERFGENFSRGYTLSGTHLIEWVYAGDAGHDSNQLGDWNAVGIAIKGTTTVLEFGWK